MQTMRCVVITGKGTLAVSENCPLPEAPCATGAFVKPLIWSPCTSDAHLCETGCESLPYLLGKAIGHEMCGEIVKVGDDVHDFKVGDKVIVDADMNLAHIPEGVTLDQAIMIPDMMCTAFTGVDGANIGFGESVAVIGVGPVGLMMVRAAVLSGAGKVYVVGSRPICFEVARAYGATKTFDYHEDGYLDAMVRENGAPFDSVIVCGGTVDAINEGLSILKKGGTLVNLSAYFGGQDIAIDPANWGFGYGDKTIKGIGCGGGRLLMERMG